MQFTTKQVSSLLFAAVFSLPVLSAPLSILPPSSASSSSTAISSSTSGPNGVVAQTFNDSDTTATGPNAAGLAQSSSIAAGSNGDSSALQTGSSDSLSANFNGQSFAGTLTDSQSHVEGPNAVANGSSTGSALAEDLLGNGAAGESSSETGASTVGGIPVSFTNTNTDSATYGNGQADAGATGDASALFTGYPQSHYGGQYGDNYTGEGYPTGYENGGYGNGYPNGQYDPQCVGGHCGAGYDGEYGAGQYGAGYDGQYGSGQYGAGYDGQYGSGQYGAGYDGQYGSGQYGAGYDGQYGSGQYGAGYDGQYGSGQYGAGYDGQYGSGEYGLGHYGAGYGSQYGSGKYVSGKQGSVHGHGYYDVDYSTCGVYGRCGGYKGHQGYQKNIIVIGGHVSFPVHFQKVIKSFYAECYSDYVSIFSLYKQFAQSHFYSVEKYAKLISGYNFDLNLSGVVKNAGFHIEQHILYAILKKVEVEKYHITFAKQQFSFFSFTVRKSNLVQITGKKVVLQIDLQFRNKAGKIVVIGIPVIIDAGNSCAWFEKTSHVLSGYKKDTQVVYGDIDFALLWKSVSLEKFYYFNKKVKVEGHEVDYCVVEKPVTVSQPQYDNFSKYLDY